ncbi:hypothetical protein [Streptomyces sp. ISL-10]|uniref:hypothetical protein n=1 Tax=Streptomyces sp. ISL-10 TaxID=2819172 RepID=UPI0027E400D1|nr:hypothetical protein [Streptomyces sp. ISL-10]
MLYTSEGVSMSGELPERPEPSISDEEWARFQIESEGPARLAAPKEPSARARMVTERLRRADEEAARQQGRARRLVRRGRPVQAQPDGWRAWPDRRTRPRRSRVWAFLWIAVAIGAVVVLLNPVGAMSWLW